MPADQQERPEAPERTDELRDILRELARTYDLGTCRAAAERIDALEDELESLRRWRPRYEEAMGYKEECDSWRREAVRLKNGKRILRTRYKEAIAALQEIRDDDMSTAQRLRDRAYTLLARHGRNDD